ncbi:protein Tob2 [Procambarus clarkii]
MRLEIKSAANFLVDLARLNNSGLTEKQLDRFRENVCNILLRHYTDHWFPDKPFKGSGYRCIRINGHLDPLIARAGFMMGLAVSFLRSLFPSELTMWVDPMEVAYRIGENGSICVLYEDVQPKCPSPMETKSPAKSMAITPVKPVPQPPPQQPASPPPALPPHHHLQQQQVTHHAHHHHHHHFSPSKSVVVSSPLHHSPPLSPVTTQQQQQQQQVAAATAMHLSMFIMGKESGSLVKCKESLRGGLDARSLQMDRLFVSS